MDIGKRIRQLREVKGLSQGDIERRSGLLRSYISRVEGGYTTPSLATLDKFAKALEVQTYQLLFQRSEEHTSELQSRLHLVCRLLLEKKKTPNRGLITRHTANSY